MDVIMKKDTICIILYTVFLPFLLLRCDWSSITSIVPPWTETVPEIQAKFTKLQVVREDMKSGGKGGGDDDKPGQFYWIKLKYKEKIKGGMPVH